MIQFKYLLFVFTVLKNEWFVYSTKSWSEQQKLAASDGMVGDWYGSSVALDGDTLVVGSYKDDDKGSNSGSVHVYVRSGTTWSVQQKLVADDGAEFDGFGRAVALSGETLVVGAYGDEDKGSVYVFVRSDTSWSKQQKITASDGAIGAYFGYSVALAVDTLVVGAEGDFVKGSFSGSVYVYVRSSSSWSLQQKITADDGLEDDYFGSSVAISGETLVVGAYGDDHGDNNMCSRCGSAYVYVRSSTSWSEQQKLVADDGFLPNTLTPKPGKIGEEFGISVAISGETLVVGAHGNTYLNDFYNGDASGSVYVYVRSGTSWFEQQEISSSASYEYFGISVALSSDNMVVGVEKGWVYEDYDLLDYDCDEVKKKTYSLPAMSGTLNGIYSAAFTYMTVQAHLGLSNRKLSRVMVRLLNILVVLWLFLAKHLLLALMEMMILEGAHTYLQQLYRRLQLHRHTKTRHFLTHQHQIEVHYHLELRHHPHCTILVSVF